jgi:GT2 family glycosyltransferase
VTEVVTAVVAVTEDRPARVLESVGSVLAQDLGDLLDIRVSVVLVPGAPGCLPVAAALARRDSRVTWQVVDPDGQSPDGSSFAPLLAAALAGVSSTWCLALEAGDILLPGALKALIATARAEPDAALVYADERWHVDGPGSDLVHRFKPRLSPHYLETNDHVGRPALHRVDALLAAGGWDPAAGDAVEWDAVLRVIDRDPAPGRIALLPKALLQRGRPPAVLDDQGGRAQSARQAGRAAVARHIGRLDQAADVADDPLPGFVRVLRRLPDHPPSVSIVIPTAGSHREIAGQDVELVAQCLEALHETTTYPNWHVHLVVSAHAPEDLEDRMRGRFGERVTATRLEPAPFNFSTSVNTGVLRTDGDLVLLLNDDVVPLTPDWLTDMVRLATDPRVGAVGAKLLDGEDLIQHVGVGHDNEFHPTHVHAMEVDGPGYFGSLAVTTNHSAVTAACLLTPREVFLEVGGFWPDLGVAYGDVDYCWKVVTSGRWCVVEPAAVLRHYESSSRPPGVRPEELAVYLEHWGSHTHADIDVQYRSVKY